MILFPKHAPQPGPAPGRIERIANNRADYLLEGPGGLSPIATAFAILFLPKPLPEPIELSWQLGRGTQTITKARALLRHVPPAVDEDGWFRIHPEILDKRYSPAVQLTWILLRRYIVDGKTGLWMRKYQYGARSLYRTIERDWTQPMSRRSWSEGMRTLQKDLWITPFGMEQVGLVIPSLPAYLLK
nr:hypothetical protein [bacterium]